jgi:hypothetical protein
MQGVEFVPMGGAAGGPAAATRPAGGPAARAGTAQIKTEAVVSGPEPAAILD